jgi:hypothetical protein
VTASLVASPASGTTATSFSFDAAGSRPGLSPIVEYRFGFGDGTADVVGAVPTITHRYSAAGSYNGTRDHPR